MLSISVVHDPQFIDANLKADKVTGANISVKITDSFMRAVVNDTEFIQQFPLTLKTRWLQANPGA